MDASNQQNASGKWHAEEKLDLMVKQAAVIEDAHDCHDRCAGQDAHDLGSCGPAEGKKNR
jgi:hypothetical protein